MIRVTIVLDRNLPDENAVEQYGTTNPYLVRAEMLREAEEISRDIAEGDLSVAGVKVEVAPW